MIEKIKRCIKRKKRLLELMSIRDNRAALERFSLYDYRSNNEVFVGFIKKYSFVKVISIKEHWYTNMEFLVTFENGEKTHFKIVSSPILYKTDHNGKLWLDEFYSDRLKTYNSVNETGWVGDLKFPVYCCYHKQKLCHPAEILAKRLYDFYLRNIFKPDKSGWQHESGNLRTHGEPSEYDFEQAEW